MQLQVVERSWFSYLEWWAARASFPISACFHVANAHVKQTRATQGPGRATEESSDKPMSSAGDGAEISVRPSMTLLLGITYFGCRWIRSGVIASDIVRLARDDQLPWFSAWGRLPEELRLPTAPVAEFFRPKCLPTSPAIVTFLAECFGLCIGCAMPDLNAAAIALRAAPAIFASPERVVENFMALLSFKGSAQRDRDLGSEARALALLTIAAALAHVHDADNCVASGPATVVRHAVRVPWSRTDVHRCPRSQLREYATFLRCALDNPNKESRMADTCSMLCTWAEMEDDHDRGQEKRAAATAPPKHPVGTTDSSNSWLAVLFERVAEHLGCQLETLARLVNEELGIRPQRQRSCKQPPREGACVTLAKMHHVDVSQSHP